MAGYSIPSSTPVNGRISTPSWRRSKKSSNHTSPALYTLQSPTSLQKQSPVFLRQRSICARKIQSAVCDGKSPSRRVKGAWWPSRSSKPLSAPHNRSRDRFDSYPLRISNRGCTRCPPRQRPGKRQTGKTLIPACLFAIESCPLPRRLKGGDPDVA